ncbi:hypothetical protein CU097_004490 [Rhizopus azygosporus]|uniref:Uncharacterized protein n=1 Tax=Rhizopus azygosporus TaxID=86630 RepID=A0A367J344_RHIAZ|nr:hypothetical protein CU097_004490 [Rhizopus azygosporus]
MSFQNSNPGNFASRPKEEVKNIASRHIRAAGSHFALEGKHDGKRASEAGSKGGRLSGGNFAPNLAPTRERAMAATLFYGQLSGPNLRYYVREMEDD